MSQAPGLSGTPDAGHCSSAATRASCARSSAKPTSRTMRVRPAISLGDSILQTASMVRCISAGGTATDHIIFGVAVQAGLRVGQKGRDTRDTEGTQSRDTVHL